MRAWWVVLLVAGCGDDVMGTPATTPDASSIDAPDAMRPDGQGTDAAPGAPLLRVSGNQIVDGNGQPVRLFGVNRSGTEYACIQGNGIFDGPNDDASLAAIRTWKANAVRVPMNEDCWLGINGVQAQYGGTMYQQAIADYTTKLLAHGLYPILELHWTAPGTQPATDQRAMPDRDHSIDFWTQVATRFAGERRIVLEMFNEPFPDSNQDTTAGWTCWKNGGLCPGVTDHNGAQYAAAGMQELVTAVRNAGAENVILLGGLEYSNALTQWLQYKPDDPTGNLGAAWHIYNFNLCSSQTCYDGAAAQVAAMVPLVATEIGEDDCMGSFITPLMTWLDGKSASYLGWTWDTWSGCLVLINNYNGTPAGVYGQTYHDHLQQVAP